MKAMKWVLIIGGGLVVLVIAALLLIPLFVDVNQFKPEIEKRVAAATGRDFSIEGDLKLSLFPWAGVAFSNLRLGAPPGFGEKDFVLVKSFDARMKLLPLLSRDIQVDRFVVDEPRIVIEKDKAGRGNWEGLGKQDEKGPTPAVPEPGLKKSEEAFVLKNLVVGEFAVRKGVLVYVDQASGSRHEVSDLTLELKDVSLDRPIKILLSAALNKMPVSLEGLVGPVGKEPGKGQVPVDVSVRASKEPAVSIRGILQDVADAPKFDLSLSMDPFSPRKFFSDMGAPFPVSTTDRAALDRVGLKGKIRGDAQQVSLSEGVLELDQSKMGFSARIKDVNKPDLSFDLDLDTIDLDRYMPPSSEKTQNKEVDASKSAPPEPGKSDYTALRKMVLDGKARVGMLKAGGVTIREIDLKVTGRNGVFHLNPLLAKLYQGTLSAKGTADLSRDVPRSSMDLETKEVQAGPLLQDLLKKDMIDGAANAQISVSMAGEQPEQLKRTLNGKGQLVFRDGAVKGIDLAGMVRNVTSAFRLDQPAEKPKTDFTELIAPFTISNGMINTQGTSLASPLIRVLATGNANLVDESLDLRVEPTFVGTLKGQDDTKDRSGIMVPVLVKGTFSKPSFQPDLKGILEQQLRERTLPSPQDLLRPKEGETKPPQERLKDMLKGLPGRR